MPPDFVVDTCALVSIALSDFPEEIISTGRWHTTGVVRNELQEMREYGDKLAEAASDMLVRIGDNEVINLHLVKRETPGMSKVDVGEASCVKLAKKIEADYLLTDDHRASYQLKKLLQAEAETTKLVHSPILFQMLLKREIISKERAIRQVTKISRQRDWRDSALFTYALRVFREE